MNLLLINHYAGSPKHGMEYRPYYLAREWVKQGHHVTIVAGSYSHLRIEQPDVHTSCAEESIDGIRYVWLNTPRYSGNGVWRVWSMLVFVFRLWWHRRRIVADFPPAVVIASSTYPLDIFPAHYTAKRYHAKLVFEVHDLWPLTPIQIGGMSPRHPFIVLMQLAENFAYRKSDCVVSMLKNAFEYMRFHGLSEDRFRYIPNGVVLSEWEGAAAPLPPQHAECLRSLRSEGRFLVGYVGGHQQSNALEFVLDAAERLRDTPAVFVLVGQGTEKEQLQNRAKDRDIANVIFLPPIPKACVPQALAAMDVLYIGWRRHPLYRYGICPNKLMDYMMAGKPVIHAVEAGNDPVAESGCGMSCSAEDPCAVADAVVRLMNVSLDQRTAMGLRGRKYVRENYSYPLLAQQFLDAVNVEVCVDKTRL